MIECFHPGVHRNLTGYKKNLLVISIQSLSDFISVKKTAYSLYTDIQHQTQFLFNYNLRHMKALDINIDLQPLYFVLPENGNYQK